MWWFSKKTENNNKPQYTNEFDLGIMSPTETQFIPGNIQLHYARLLKAMKRGDLPRVLTLQLTLYRLGWHFPVSLREAEDLVRRLPGVS